MQTKIFTAAIAALTFSSAQAAVVKRDVGVNLGTYTVTPPTFSVDPNQVALVVYGLLDQLTGDIAKTVGAVNQLNNNTQNTATEKYNFALQVVALAKANADQIVATVNDTLSKLKPATSSKTPATPTMNSGPSPTETVVKTANDIAAKAEAAVAQVGQLQAAAITQVNALVKQLKGTVDFLTAFGLKQLTDAITSISQTLTGVVNTIATAALSALSTALSTAQATITTGQDTANGAVTRISNAQVELNPAATFSLGPKVSI